jgi:hypothetical protein
MECKKCLYLLIDGKYYLFCGMKLCMHCDEDDMQWHEWTNRAKA